MHFILFVTCTFLLCVEWQYFGARALVRHKTSGTTPLFGHYNHHLKQCTWILAFGVPEKWQEYRPLLWWAERAFVFRCCLFFSSSCSDTFALSEWHWHTFNRSLPLPSNNIKHTEAEARAHKFQQADIFAHRFTACSLINFSLLFFSIIFPLMQNIFLIIAIHLQVAGRPTNLLPKCYIF